MHEKIIALARENGFSETYFLEPKRLNDWEGPARAQGTLCGMSGDVPASFPYAKSILLLIKPFSPFPPGERISPYYIASNEGYFAMLALIEQLRAAGFRAENAWLPARALALANNVGSRGKNALLSIEPYGTRMAIFTVATDACGPKEYAKAQPGCPEGCRACMEACPPKGISEGGFDAYNCMRFYMDEAEHPPYVMERFPVFGGCELCQSVCPKNAGLKIVEPPEDIKKAFELRRLIRGDAKAARELYGKNLTGGGKLSAEAIAFAAREGLYEADIRAALSSEHEAVRKAAAWALARYFDI